MERRDFLALSALAVAARPVLGANERIRIGLIGAGLRGRSDAGCVAKASNAEIVAVSDVYVPRREKAVAKFGPSAKPVKDYRAILDDKDIDGVIVAAPDHWHVRMALEAVSAGKDVYVEKPVTHSIEEGEKLIYGITNSKRVVATGTQQRSWSHYLKARDLVSTGQLGHVGLTESYWYQNYANLPKVIERALDEPTVDPSQLDWNQWLGSAPKQPFDPIKFHYWRFFPDFGGGIFTDLMTHWIDVIQWFMDTPQPSLTQATGATHKFNQFQLPDTVSAGFEFPNNYTSAFTGSLTCGLTDGGIIFRGDKAMLKLTRAGYWLYEEPQTFGSQNLPDPAQQEKSSGDGTIANVGNWIDCIRSRQTPNANIHAGVAAAKTAHLANLAMQGRRTILGALG
jgi:predicted dehydrogenase